MCPHTTHMYMSCGQAVQGGRAGADVKLGAGGHGTHASGCAPRGACRKRKKIRIPHGLPPGLVSCSCCGGVAWLSFFLLSFVYIKAPSHCSRRWCLRLWPISVWGLKLLGERESLQNCAPLCVLQKPQGTLYPGVTCHLDQWRGHTYPSTSYLFCLSISDDPNFFFPFVPVQSCMFFWSLK